MSPPIRGRAAARPAPRRAPRRAGGSCAREAQAPRARAPRRRDGRPRRPRLRERRGFPRRRRAALRAARPARRGSSASSTDTSQPAAFSPNVVGTACWRRVRAAIGVERWARASAAQPSASRSSSASTMRRRDARRASRPCRRCPGWSRPDGRNRRLVADRGAELADERLRRVPGRAAVSREARGRRARRGRPLRSERRRPRGRGRPRRHAFASALSASSIPAATRDPRPPPAAPPARRWPRTASHREERRLAGPWRTMSKRSPPSPCARRGSPARRLEPEEHRVLRVRRLLVGEVHAGRDALEEAASEDADEQVRRLKPPVHPRHAAGLHRDELEAAGVLGARAPEAR